MTQGRLHFSSVSVSFLIHATEDEERLITAVQGALEFTSEEMSKEELQGHFGNRLVCFKAHIIGERADQISSKVLSGLIPHSRESLVQNIEKHLDEHDSLYLRLDRQELPESFVLTEDEPIRIKLKPKIRKNRDATLGDYLELLEN